MGTGRIITCCDLHGRTCEPPSELCCYACTEAVHQIGDATRGWHIADRSRCSNPDLSGTGTDAFFEVRPDGKLLTLDPREVEVVTDRDGNPVAYLYNAQ